MYNLVYMVFFKISIEQNSSNEDSITQAVVNDLILIKCRWYHYILIAVYNAIGLPNIF